MCNGYHLVLTRRSRKSKGALLAECNLLWRYIKANAMNVIRRRKRPPLMEPAITGPSEERPLSVDNKALLAEMQKVIKSSFFPVKF